MTTDQLERDGPTQTLAAARLGALAGVTPVVMFISWSVVAPWSGTSTDFITVLAVIAAIAIVAGWIVGGRIGRSITSSLLGGVAYPVVTLLILLPIGVIAATWAGIQDGMLTDPTDVLVSMAGFLLYGAVSLIYLFLFITPFSVGWALTYYALRRGMRV